MYKCSIDLFRVNPTCLVKFNIVVNNDTQNNKYRELVNKFTINGDTYFKIHRENHNLDRARNQFKLVEDMAEKENELKLIVKGLN